MNSPQVRCHKSATSEDKVASESELKIVIALSTESIFLNKIFYLNIILVCYYDRLISEVISLYSHQQDLKSQGC